MCSEWTVFIIITIISLHFQSLNYQTQKSTLIKVAWTGAIIYTNGFGKVVHGSGRAKCLQLAVIFIIIITIFLFILFFCIFIAWMIEQRMNLKGTYCAFPDVQWFNIVLRSKEQFQFQQISFPSRWLFVYSSINYICRLAPKTTDQHSPHTVSCQAPLNKI